MTDQWSQAIPALATEACELATKSHMLNFCQGLRDLCRDMLWLSPIETDNAGHKRFSILRKKRAILKTKKNITMFEKLLFLTKYRMRSAIYMPPNT